VHALLSCPIIDSYSRAGIMIGQINGEGLRVEVDGLSFRGCGIWPRTLCRGRITSAQNVCCDC
jgi:hypothetical protein